MSNNKGSGWVSESWALNDNIDDADDHAQFDSDQQDRNQLDNSRQIEHVGINKTVVNAEENVGFDGGQSVGEITNLLGANDRKLLNAMASMQMKYGQVNEAIAILLLCRLSDNGDLQTLRLLIRAYIRMEWWDKAAEMNKEYKYFSKKESKTGYLLNALILLGQAKLGKAREQFKMFINNKVRPNN